MSGCGRFEEAGDDSNDMPEMNRQDSRQSNRKRNPTQYDKTSLNANTECHSDQARCVRCQSYDVAYTMRVTSYCG